METCNICLSVINLKTYLNKCQSVNGKPLHVYCLICILKWIMNVIWCPLCRVSSEMVCCEDLKMCFKISILQKMKIDIFAKVENRLSRCIILSSLISERQKLIEIINKSYCLKNRFKHSIFYAVKI